MVFKLLADSLKQMTGRCSRVVILAKNFLRSTRDGQSSHGLIIGDDITDDMILFVMKSLTLYLLVMVSLTRIWSAVVRWFEPELPRKRGEGCYVTVQSHPYHSVVWYGDEFASFYGLAERVRLDSRPIEFYGASSARCRTVCMWCIERCLILLWIAE